LLAYDTCIIGGKAKKLKANFLTLETLNPTLCIFSSVSGYEYYSIERRIATSMVSIVFLLYLGIRMLFSITAIHLQKKTIENVKNNTNSFNLL
jgi:hypothetical protein